jgi:hypothetical protein
MESRLGPLGTLATSGLLYLLRVTVRMENLIEWRLVRETEVLGENLHQRHFPHQKSHFTRPGANPGRRSGKAATNLLSYGAASLISNTNSCLILLNKCCICEKYVKRHIVPHNKWSLDNILEHNSAHEIEIKYITNQTSQ